MNKKQRKLVVPAELLPFFKSRRYRLWLAETPEVEKRPRALGIINNACDQCYWEDLSISQMASVADALEVLSKDVPGVRFVSDAFMAALAIRSKEERIRKAKTSLAAIRRCVDDWLKH